MQLVTRSRPDQKDPSTQRDPAGKQHTPRQLNNPSNKPDQKPDRIRRASSPTRAAAWSASSIKPTTATNPPKSTPTFTSIALKTQKYQEKFFRRSNSDESILRPLSSSTLSSGSDSDIDDFTADSILDSAESMGNSIHQRATGRIRASTINVTSTSISSVLGGRTLKVNSAAPSVGKEQVVSIYRNAVYDPVVFNVLAVEPKVIAAQLALIDSALFRNIEESELRSLAWTGIDKFTLSPNIVKMTNGFNHVALWVSQEIVDCRQEKRRLQKINYFIAVARACLSLKNFNGLKSVLTGLECSPVHRLKGTWAMVNKREKNLIAKLSKLMSPDNNTHYYRRSLEKVNYPCIPYLGLYLMDLTFMVEARKTEKGGSLAAREDQISGILAQCRRFQENCYYKFEELSSIRDVLVTEKYINELQFFWEDKHYAKSYQIEPKASAVASNKIASKPFNHDISLSTSYDDNRTRKCTSARSTHVTIDLITGQSARFSESLTAAGLDLAISRSMGEHSARSREPREGLKGRVILSVDGLPPRRNAVGGGGECISSEYASTRQRTISDIGPKPLARSTPSRIGQYRSENSAMKKEAVAQRRKECPAKQLPDDFSSAQGAPTFSIPDYSNDKTLATANPSPSSIATPPRKFIVRTKSSLSITSSVYSDDSDSEDTEQGQTAFTPADNDFDISSSISFRSTDSKDDAAKREGTDIDQEDHTSPRQRSLSYQQKRPASAHPEYGHERRSSADYSTKPDPTSTRHKISASASSAIPNQRYIQKSTPNRTCTPAQHDANKPTAPQLVNRSLSFSATDSAILDQRTSPDSSATPDDLVAPLKRAGILYKKDRALSDGRRAKRRDWRKVYAVLQGAKVKFYVPPPYLSSIGSSSSNRPSMQSPSLSPSASVGENTPREEAESGGNANNSNTGRLSVGEKWTRWRSGSVGRNMATPDLKGKITGVAKGTEDVPAVRVDVPQLTTVSGTNPSPHISLPLLEVAEFVPPCSITRATDYKKRPFVLRLRPNKNGEMLLRCKDEVSMNSWSEDIEKSMVKLTTRKGNLIALNSTHPTS